MPLKRFYLVGLAAFSLVFSLASIGDAQARSFTARFSQDLSGNITFAANSLMTCSTTGQHGSSCSASRNNTGLGSAADATLTNNYYDMVNVDVDGDPSTSNSSSATLSIPAGSSIAWAGLYWAANAPDGMTTAQAKSIKLKGPGDSTYSSLTASGYDAAPGSVYGYDCFLDVTDLVQSKGAGQWTAAGVTNRPAAGTQAGWSLIVVYQNNSEPSRNITVFDGQAIVSGTDEVSIPISGFRTPPTGTVDTTVGLVTFEGDRGIVGDYAQLDGDTLSDAKHLSTNFFNSWITNQGAPVSGRNPSYSNQLGFEANSISVGSLLGNNATSTTLRAKTNGDGYEPLVVSFATELYAPHFNPTKSVTDLNGGEVRPGDVLEYTIDLENDGGDNATNMVFSESAMPSGTTYVGNSVTVDDVAPAAGLADQPANGGTGALTLRLGTGASASVGGTIAPGESHQIKFRVTVISPLPAQGAKISNQALMNFVFESLGQPMQIKTNTADITVNRPDLAMHKTVTSAHIADGLPGQYTLSVSNVGLADSSGTVTVTDHLPSQFKNPSVGSATGWACGITSGTLTCTRSDALAPGEDYPNIVVDSPGVDIPGGEVVANTAQVATDFDADPSNDSSTVSTSEQGSSTLTVNNSAGSASVAPGSTVQFTADYTNTGPSVALQPTIKFALSGTTSSNVSISDYTVSSSDGSVSKDDCAVSSPSNVPTITCTPSSLKKDASVQIIVSLVPDADTTLSSFATRATVQAGNDSSSPHTDDASVNLLPSADLQMVKTASPSQAERGQAVTYTLLVSNEGPSSSGIVTITDPAPSGLTVQSADWSKSTGATGTCVVSSNTVTCSNLPSIRPGQTLTATVHAIVAQTGKGYQDNTASAQLTVNDPDPSNNSSTSRFTVLPSANLEINKSGPSNLAPEQSGIFTLRVTNHGPSSATGTTVREQMPQGMSPIGKLPAGCLRAGQNINCSAGTIPSGGTKTYRFRMQLSAKAKPGNSLVNKASVSSAVTELVPSNNSDQVAVAVSQPTRPRLGIKLFASPRHGAQPGQLINIAVRITNKHYATVKHPKACITVPLNLWGNPYRHICWYSGPLGGYTSRTFHISLLTRRSGMGILKAGAEAQNAPWVGTRQIVTVQGGFTG